MRIGGRFVERSGTALSNGPTTHFPDRNGSEEFLDWMFIISAPIGNFKNVTAQLTELQQAVAQKKNGIAVLFSVRGTHFPRRRRKGPPAPLLIS